jgi:glycerophosphoryl diester phosphodiesterase
VTPGDTSVVSTPRTGFAYLDEPREQGAVLALAHRGGAPRPELVGLENTMKAFESAVGLGYRYLETDVHATSDREVVAFHDLDLMRLTGGPGRLGDLTWSEAATMLVGGTEAIPRLVDLLEAFPDARFNVDLKTASVVEPMVDLIVHGRLQDRLCIGAFNERVMRRFRRLLATAGSPPVATSCGVAAATAVAFAPGGRHLLPLFGDPGVVLQVPPRHKGFRVIDRAFVRRAHAAGRQVHAWTINDRAEMEHLLDLDVDGIFTDRTDLLRDVLVDRGRWF